ncbi:unnamed protein product, partial [Rotaria sordida]
MDDDDTSYVCSGSSSVNNFPVNLASDTRNMNTSIFSKFKYKPSTRKRKFGRKKRKHVFQKKSLIVPLAQTQLSSKIFPSVKRITGESISSRTSQIFDIQYFQQVFNNAHVCSNNGRLEFIADTSPSVGLFHFNALRCTSCGKETPVTNFSPIDPVQSVQQEPNERLVVAAATTGIGYKATKYIMSTLGLSITTEKAFLHQLHKYYDALHVFAKQKLQSVIDELKYKHGKQHQIMNVTVSLDGTWKRRGHVSNFGIVFLIHVDSGKCIDYEVLSLLCEKCKMKKATLSKKEFKKWYSKHQRFCEKNFHGTSKSMEKAGAIRLFQRSLVNGLRYKFMLCDGDSSAYESVKYYYINKEQQQISNTHEDSVDESLGCEGSGDGRSGDEGSGDGRSGDEGSGDGRSGDEGSGDEGSGDGRSGDEGLGDRRSGDEGSGDESSGDGRSGDEGSGNESSDDEGSGDGRSGD